MLDYGCACLDEHFGVFVFEFGEEKVLTWVYIEELAATVKHFLLQSCFDPWLSN
jgi:hypothetical protein